MRGECSTRGFTIAGHDIDHALGKSSFCNQLSQQQHRKWSLFGGFQNNAASCGECRSKLPRGHEQGEVPRDNLADYADRLATSIRKILGALGADRNRNSIALDLGRPSCHVVEQVNGQRHVGNAGDGERLSVVEAFELRELFCAGLDEIGELPNESPTLRGRHVRPRRILKGCACGSDRAVYVFLVAFGNLSEYLASRRIVSWKGFARSRGHPLVVNKHVPWFVDEFLDPAVDCCASYGCCHRDPPWRAKQ